jgi:hypothetical protein
LTVVRTPADPGTAGMLAAREATQMHDVRFPIEVFSGVPVVAAPEEIDITSAPELRAALLEAAMRGDGTLVADLTRTRFCTHQSSAFSWRCTSGPQPKAVSCC